MPRPKHGSRRLALIRNPGPGDRGFRLKDRSNRPENLDPCPRPRLARAPVLGPGL